MKIASRQSNSPTTHNENRSTPLPFTYSPAELEKITVQNPVSTPDSPQSPTLAFLTRIRSYDRGTLRENVTQRCYASRISLLPTDRWMDAGGHIGIFSCSISQSVAAVYPYEPFPGSYSLLRRNLELNRLRNVYPQNVALTHDDADFLTLNLNSRGSHGVHSILPLHGRRPLRVPCVNIDDQIREHRITSVKMDVEGAESLLIPGISDESWKQIDQIVLEYHFSYLRDYDRTQYRSLVQLLHHYFSHFESSLSSRERTEIPQDKCTDFSQDTPKTCILYARK